METVEVMRELIKDFKLWSPEGQIRWLRKKGFSPQVIDAAMTDLYYLISKGKQFSTGDEMDQHLLKITKGYADTEARSVISAANTLKKQIEGGRLKKLWWVLKGEL